MYPEDEEKELNEKKEEFDPPYQDNEYRDNDDNFPLPKDDYRDEDEEIDVLVDDTGDTIETVDIDDIIGTDDEPYEEPTYNLD